MIRIDSPGPCLRSLWPFLIPSHTFQRGGDDNDDGDRDNEYYDYGNHDNDYDFRYLPHPTSPPPPPVVVYAAVLTTMTRKTAPLFLLLFVQKYVLEVNIIGHRGDLIINVSLPDKYRGRIRVLEKNNELP